ncbi:MAG TPA: histidinol-phosphate transaminase [Acidimicrobiales bacterium]|nr:histidinol-phosphate transaminase [Acidimicrobiales bacterium]
MSGKAGRSDRAPGPDLPPVRGDLAALTGYHSAQVDVDVRLNTNESPLPPPVGWYEALAAGVADIQFNRYPDREARLLRRALADEHGVASEQVYCANGSNEVLQALLLAYGGPDRRAALFEPTYTLHRHIARITQTPVAAGRRREDFTLDLDEVDRVLDVNQPALTFLCSPNNPTGRAEPPEMVAEVAARAPGLLVVDEAYGQFAPFSALEVRGSQAPGAGRVVVVRTFSKTWSMAAARLGYLVGPAEVVAACELVTLPYHLDAVTQLAGRLALQFRAEMEARVALLTEERGRLAAALSDLPVETWPSDANFILFRPRHRSAEQVWTDLVAASVLVRDCSRWPGLDGCLRVTVGLPEENDRFLEALGRSL